MKRVQNKIWNKLCRRNGDKTIYKIAIINLSKDLTKFNR